MNHRELLLEELKKWEFDSVLDVGCGRGEDLELIKKQFPNVRIAGMDTSKERIIQATGKLGNIQLIVGDTSTLPFEDKSFDLVFTDALFVMIQDAGRVVRIIKEMERVARKYLLFLEPHSEEELAPYFYGITKANDNNYNVRNYKSILSRFNTEFIKIPKNVWPGMPWEFYGYIIKINL